MTEQQKFLAPLPKESLDVVLGEEAAGSSTHGAARDALTTKFAPNVQTYVFDTKLVAVWAERYVNFRLREKIEA